VLKFPAVSSSSSNKLEMLRKFTDATQQMSAAAICCLAGTNVVIFSQLHAEDCF
jgi:hypothetical protein